jgi:hypothetical protein
MSNMNHAALKAPHRAKPPGPRSPERAALADAIARRTAAEQMVESSQRALDRVRDARDAAEAKVEAARLAVTEAGAQDADALADAVAGGETVTTTHAMRGALTRAQDAEHELAAATSAHAKLKARLGDAEDALLHAQNLVVACADVVLRASAESALAEAETLALRLRELGPLLWFYLDPSITPEHALSSPRRPMFSTDWNDEVRRFGRERAIERNHAAGDAVALRDGAFNEELGPAIKRFVEAPPHLNGWDWHRQPSLEPWHKCREALIAGDPDAPTPELPA